MLKFTWDLISDGLVSTYIVNVGNVFTSKEPTIFRCTCAIKEDLRVILEELHSAEFSWILLRMFRQAQ